jgi:hypothetical protein
LSSTIGRAVKAESMLAMLKIIASFGHVLVAMRLLWCTLRAPPVVVVAPGARRRIVIAAELWPGSNSHVRQSISTSTMLKCERHVEIRVFVLISI